VAGVVVDFYWAGRGNPDLLRLNRILVNSDFGVFGLAFSLGKGVEVWTWLRERFGLLTPSDDVPARSETSGSARSPRRRAVPGSSPLVPGGVESGSRTLARFAGGRQPCLHVVRARIRTGRTKAVRISSRAAAQHVHETAGRE
jgi:hypothetical protein